VTGAAPLETAGPSELAYMDNARYGDALVTTRALACLVSPRFAPGDAAEGQAAFRRDEDGI
jgi:UDP-3-O-[3-hydroxymyristoyl] glucosamine N-acyltransferase